MQHFNYWTTGFQKKRFLSHGCITTFTESCTLISLEHCQTFLIRYKDVEKYKLSIKKEAS